jgi:small subunit ribosomal protein S6
MEKYELTLVLDGKTTPAKRKAVAATVEKIVAILKGKIGKVEEWGEKELAYKIGKSQSGYFIHYPLELEPSQVKALNLKLKMENDVVRHLLVRKDN